MVKIPSKKTATCTPQAGNFLIAFIGSSGVILIGVRAGMVAVRVYGPAHSRASGQRGGYLEREAGFFRASRAVPCASLALLENESRRLSTRCELYSAAWIKSGVATLLPAGAS